MKKLILFFCFINLFCGLSLQVIAQNCSALFDGITNAGSRMRVTDGTAANPNAFRINGNKISVEAWIYPIAFPNPQYGNTIIERGLNTTYSDPWISYRLWINHSNGVSLPAFSISAGTPSSTITVQSPDDIPIFQWTHLAATYDGTFLNIYVNGVLKAQVNTSISINSENGIGLYVGRFIYDTFQGAISEVRLWNTTRSQSDILNLMNTQLSGNEAGLAGYWNMNCLTNVPDPWRYLDQTANHNDLVLTNPTYSVPLNPFFPTGTPELSIIPGSIDCECIEQGSAFIRHVTVRNNGTGFLLGEISQTTVPTANVSSKFTFFLYPGESTTLLVGMVPLVLGRISGSLKINSNASQIGIPFIMDAIPLEKIDANEISMCVSRNGRLAFNPIPDPPPSLAGFPGFEWPKGSGKYSIYSSGLWVAAKVNIQIRTALALFTSEFQPGPILSTGGVAANPDDSTYRVYKIKTGDNSITNTDYAQWPTSLGAPVNPDGTPKIIGEQTLFSVYNDLDPTYHSGYSPPILGGFGTTPLGAEVQQTTFAFKNSTTLSNTVFLYFKIINKSNSIWQDTYIALFSDPDLGDATDDLVGSDVPRNLGYVYNGLTTDAVYGNAPPAVGYKVLKGAFFTKPIQAFSYFINPYGDPNTASKVYNYMQGLWPDGMPNVDPTTNSVTTFALNGDPVAGTGWIDSSPGDRRFLFSTGPFNLDPGQSKEFVAAIIIGQGSTNINSITALRSASDEIQSLYDNGQIFGGALVGVASASVSSGDTTTINDISRSGALITFIGGTGGATVESASYIEAPPGASSITTPSVGSVGKYLDVQVQGTVVWPIPIRIYYTRNDLLQAGVVESDLQGIYYWQGLTNKWILYSNSGSDDQGRGPSTTWIDTANVIIHGVNYEGFATADAYHLTQMILAAKKKSITERYNLVTQFIQSLPDDAFKKPADTRRKQLAKMLDQSKSKYDSGNLKSAAQYLEKNVLNHLTSDGKASSDLWVTDNTSCKTLLRMINELIDVLLRPQTLGKMVEGNVNVIENVEIPTEYGLSQNYPNPFNPITRIRFGLPENVHTKLIIYDVLGREVATLLDNDLSAGYHEVEFNGSNLPSGIYIYRIQAGEFTSVKKMILMK